MRSALAVASLLLLAALAAGEERFPPPEFTSGYELPETTTPAPRALAWEVADVVLLTAALGLGAWLAIRRRSRTGVAWLGLGALVYFGFWREGCVCPVGATQNVVLALFDSTYALPFGVLAFFLLPLVVALFAGRSFCGGVCPLGALQDVVLLRPVRVPDALDRGLRVVPWVYLGLAVLFAATGASFLICRYDPFVGVFRMSAGFDMLVVGGCLLLIGIFVGRPYCRWLCPYGVLLELASRLSRWRVTVTPAECVHCRLCEDACPFGALALPSPRRDAARRRRAERGLIVRILLLPVLAVVGAILVGRAGPALARAHPTVALLDVVEAERDLPTAAVSDETAAFRRSGESPDDLRARAQDRTRSFVVGGRWLGGFLGLVVGLLLVGAAALPVRTDHEADRGRCLSCARCFDSCPVEHERRGTAPGRAS